MEFPNVSTKGDRIEVEQNFEQQPSDFCHTHQLPRPLRFNAEDIGKRDSDVLTQLASLAVYPHLKRARFAYDLWQDGGWKMLAVGAGVIAIFGFLMGNLK
uniref:Uncharacterized protein n=1 Tax=Acrobeloides nanus TaxID=290746 RepID=A0A914D6P4_9BILA